MLTIKILFPFHGGREKKGKDRENKKEVKKVKRITLSNLSAANGIQTYKFKTDYSGKAQYFLPARFSEETIKAIEKNIFRAFRLLNFRDIARFDIRADKSGIPYVLKVNAVMGLEKEHSDFPRMYNLIGKTYEDLINDMLNSTLERVSRNEVVLF